MLVEVGRVMASIQSQSLSLLLKFIFKGKTLDDAVKFHNDILGLYLAYKKYPNYIFQKNKINDQKSLEEVWQESDVFLYWLLFVLNEGVIPKDVANDIFRRFSDAYKSNRVLII